MNVITKTSPIRANVTPITIDHKIRHKGKNINAFTNTLAKDTQQFYPCKH